MIAPEIKGDLCAENSPSTESSIIQDPIKLNNAPEDWNPWVSMTLVISERLGPSGAWVTWTPGAPAPVSDDAAARTYDHSTAAQVTIAIGVMIVRVKPCFDKWPCAAVRPYTGTKYSLSKRRARTEQCYGNDRGAHKLGWAACNAGEIAACSVFMHVPGRDRCPQTLLTVQNIRTHTHRTHVCAPEPVL